MFFNLPELANYYRSFLLNPKYNDTTVPLCLKIREAKDDNGPGDIWGTTVWNKDEELKTFWESIVLREYRMGDYTRRL